MQPRAALPAVQIRSGCGSDADYDVPDRKSEGYGINERII